jgi:hypothetical protein
MKAQPEHRIGFGWFNKIERHAIPVLAEQISTHFMRKSSDIQYTQNIKYAPTFC